MKLFKKLAAVALAAVLALTMAGCGGSGSVLMKDELLKLAMDQMTMNGSTATHSKELDALAAKLARAMKEVLGFTDMNILQNNGPIAGQTVFHFHIHLIPRREGDGINVTWTPTEPTDEQIAAVQAKLTNLI